jgi:hypothetical protein
MIIDRQSTVSLNQAVTATAVSTDTIDLLVAGRDIGNGEDINVEIICTETAVSGGATTVTFELINSANADLSSPVVLAATPAIGKAAIVIGAMFLRQIVPLNDAPLRYLGVRYTVATGPLTAGRFTATFGADRQASKAYRSGVPVSGF